MVSNRLAFAALGLACVTAAGGGAYLATKNNQAEVASPAATSSRAVQETEGTLPEAPETAGTPGPRGAVPLRAEAPALPSETTVARSNAPARPTRTARPETAPNRTRAAGPVSAPSAGAASANVVNDPRQPAEAPIAPATIARNDESAGEALRPAPEPPAPAFHELVISADSVVGLQLESSLTSERARVEDRVDARVVRDIRVGSEVAVPAGSRAVGSVMTVERGGKLKERARLGIRFHTLVLGDGTQIPITSETIYRVGESPSNGSAAKIGGGAVAGAILGAIIGGAKGAAIGGTAGAGAGTAAVVSGDRNAATFPSGAEVTARIVSPVAVTVEK